MTPTRFSIAILLTTSALSACNPYTFNREAGNMDNGDFGNATMQNTLLASGQIQPPMGYDKYDAPAAGRLLSGKYAAVIWQGYMAGGTSQHAGTAAGSPTPSGASTSGSGSGSGSGGSSSGGSAPTTTQ